MRLPAFLTVSIVAGLLFVCLQLMVSRLLHSGDGRFRQEVTDFQGDVDRGMIERISFEKVRPKGSLSTLDRGWTTIDRERISKIEAELVFSESPSLPLRMHHSSDIEEAILQCANRNGRSYSIHVTFRQGRAGNGVEFMMALPQRAGDGEPLLPGNYCIGHGFSVALFDILRED